MSDHDLQESVAGKTLSRSAIAQLMGSNFHKLPDTEQKIFKYGPVYVGGNAALAGLLANSFYRRVLNVTQATIASSLPMAVLPFMSTYVFYNAIVSSPLLSGDLQCPGCVLLRGALAAVVGGGVYPIILALPVNVGLATRYNTAPMPEKGNTLRFWIDISRPVLKKMWPALILQALFATFLSSRTFESYLKLSKVALDSQREELQN
ncbi:transmembrane protein 126A [Nerophis lumbriciformis]|uniref:transmembrane protein 126A n=1 Tax=Nerophis lumbriciformis TaxID=546530 RepID=UPI002AE08B02|nr:transmembrane protein 126A-like [Nerophis lumbriciformis]